MINPDFRDILSIFNEESVEYLLVGAYALAAHGNPRATKDIDLWVSCSPENAKRLFVAMARFGAPLTVIQQEDFFRPGITFQIGVAPRRIDVVTEIDGVEFEVAYPRRKVVSIDGIEVPVISRTDMLANKRAAGRPQDLADAAFLEQQESE